MTFISSPQDLIRPVRINWALAAGVAVHLLFALSFIAVLALATTRAQAQDVACKGKNLLASLAQEYPETLAHIRAEAARIPNGEGLLWRIEKDGTRPSWLYGTMHVADPRVLEMTEAAQKGYGEADTIVVEITEIADLKKSMGALMADPAVTMLPDGKTLQDLLDKDGLAHVEAVLEARNIPLTFVSRMKPWIIFSLISMPECEYVRQNEGAAFLDEMLARQALEEGKTLKGLETVEEQLSALSGLPVDLQARLLADTAALGPVLDDVMVTMTELYLDGQIGMIMPLIQATTAETGAAEGPETAGAYAAFEKRLVLTRNHNMAERLQPILEGGNVFVAVGALHLPGEEGVVQLLREAGYTVTAGNGDAVGSN